ncbi:MAG: hypothetical protein HY302_06635 [Opitutae bacterium]|nr:hypothetical protein [Opitutae bacterium]
MTSPIIPKFHFRLLAASAAWSMGVASPLAAHEEPKPAHPPAEELRTETGPAWGAINQLREQLASAVTTKNLKPVHETTEQLTAALIRLREASTDLPADQRKRVQGAVANLAKALAATHDAADAGDQAGTEKQLKTIDALLKLLAAQFPAAATAAPPMAMGAADHGAHNETAAPAEPTVRIAFQPAAAPIAGARVPVVVKLTTRDGRPVTADDLELAHTQRVHLLIVDASLTDYLHEHPVETAPGEWSFTFAPKTGGNYTVFADLLPKATGAQEYTKTTVYVDGAPRPLDTSLNLTATADGYRFDLTIPAAEPLTAGTASLVAVKVTRSDGTPANNLEPLMGAFAHGVGFTADLGGVLHVHPMGREPELDAERGGPDLTFHLQPSQPGFFKFYVQAQIDGRSRFAGFGLFAAPAKLASASAAAAAGSPGTLSCPMHPEITSQKTGAKCSKCGMTLIAQK